MLAELKAMPQQQIMPDSLGQNQKMPPIIKDEKMEKVRILEESSYKYYQAKNYDRAIDELNQLIKLMPDKSAGYYNNIGMCYMDQEKYKEAIDNYLIAAKTDVKFSSAYNNIGTCYERMNDIPKARDSYRKALEIDPANELAKQNLEKLK
jgi:tetratricopeptide (TPR) repeat protein